MPRVVMLGTGTNVGKTHVTRALALSLRSLSPQATVVALKPIESGFATGSESDANCLAAVASEVTLPRPHPLFALPDPVSPHLAARRAKQPPIQVEAVAAWLGAWETQLTPHVVSSHLWPLVETAGAVFSPISSEASNFELAKALEPSIWVLVAPDCLGVLHDVRVTWEACARRGRVPDYLVLSAARPPDASTGTNLEELRTLGIADPLQCVARDSQDLSPLARALLTREAAAR
jgi:dethiobiotin synthetase